MGRIRDTCWRCEEDGEGTEYERTGNGHATRKGRLGD